MSVRKVFYLAIWHRHQGRAKLVLLRQYPLHNKGKPMSRLAEAVTRITMTLTSSRLFKRFGLISVVCIISACAGNTALQRQQYDFGLSGLSDVQSNPPDKKSPAQRVQIILADIQVVPPLDSNAMWYRLQYENVQQLKTYAQARWSMPPAQLFAQRLKIKSLSGGVRLISSNDSISGIPVLHLEIDEFSQIFTSISDNHAQINVRATLSKGNMIISQRRFATAIPGKTADAAGGAYAMKEASDLLINDLEQWLFQLTIK